MLVPDFRGGDDRAKLRYAPAVPHPRMGTDWGMPTAISRCFNGNGTAGSHRLGVGRVYQAEVTISPIPRLAPYQTGAFSHQAALRQAVAENCKEALRINLFEI
jgi:hypothetical protein